jgi:hypothetical protein
MLDVYLSIANEVTCLPGGRSGAPASMYRVPVLGVDEGELDQRCEAAASSSSTKRRTVERGTET